MFGPDWEEECKSCSFWADNCNEDAWHRQISFAAAERTALLAPAIISALGNPDLTGRIGNALTSRDQHVNLV